MIYKDWADAGIYFEKVVRGKSTCPQCSEDRKKKHSRCLRVYPTSKSWHCFHCGWHGFLRDSNYRETMVEKKYMLPELKPLPLSDRTKGWFASRGIKERVLEYFKISESVEWMYGDKVLVEGVEKELKEGHTTCINFPYHEGNTLVNVKFRAAGKRFKLSKNAKLILYNLNAIKGSDTAIICEGELDAMSFYQADQFHVVSVPNGANVKAINQNLEYLDNCIDYFEDKKKIYIATDGDEAGNVLRDELIRRLGRERCYVVEYPEGCKDANEVLLSHGVDGVRKLIKTAQLLPLEGIFSAEDIENNVLHIYKYGYPKGDRIGYDHFDDLISFRPGELTTITGIPNSGKSNMVDQWMVRLAARFNWRFGIFSPEQQPTELHVSSLCQKYIGEGMDGPEKMNELKLKQALGFVNSHFSFMKLDEMDTTVDGIIAKAKELVARKGINGLLIDPYNYIEHKIPKGYTETQYISELLTKIKSFKQTNNVHVFLIAHPTKIPKNRETGNYEVPTLYQIAGSSHFYNKTDNGITVYRDFNTNIVTAYIQKIRFRWIGKIGSANFAYDIPTGRYAYVGYDDISYPPEFESELKPPGKAVVQANIPLSHTQPKPMRFPEESTASYIGRFDHMEEEFSLETDDTGIEF